MRNPPVASYRLQLHGDFAFADAARIVPYLADLGVSHLYLSPIFTAAPGSTHGYDVFDPREVNPALGGREGLEALFDVVGRHGMLVLLDIVPNHVGVAGAAQPWWRDVLRSGRDSSFAPFFDIDWDAAGERPAGKLCLAVLGAAVEEAIAAGDLRLAMHDGEAGIEFGAWLPLAPETYEDVLGVSALLAEASGGAPPRLPATVRGLGGSDLQERRAALDAFVALQQSDPHAAAVMQAAIEAINAESGHDRLRRIVERQHYWLTNWRTVGVEFNYRRFFAIDDLAAIRAEDERVFDYTHELVLELAAHPVVAGLRVDHVDGLHDPAGYMYRLRQRLDGLAGPRRIVLVEKILAAYEPLLVEWPIEGATGYEFLGKAGGLFVDGDAEAAMTATYADFTGQRLAFEQVETIGREEFVESEFVAERERLLGQLRATLDAQPAPEDGDLRDALTAVLTGMRRYRTYLAHGATSADDNAVLAEALRAAEARRPELAAAINAIASALHPEADAERASLTAQRARFRRRFDQVASAVAAKGVEDTAFYRYSRLLSLNEVGATPEEFGTDPEHLHDWLAARASDWPLAMSASSTHDTKRDEDVRARIAAISEIPEEWAREVTAWREMNAGYRLMVHGEGSPAREREYYVYQTLVGSWEGRTSEAYRDRIVEHLVKAMREAKQRTTWIDPDNAYERAARDFISLILADQTFVARLNRFVERVAGAGRLNALSALVLKAMAPGFPDLYQGTESASYSLTDPDNRRPVNFEDLEQRLGTLTADAPALTDPDMKLWLTRKLLHARRSLGEVMVSAVYAPVPVEGTHATRLFAFHRGVPGGQVVTVLPRLTMAIAAEDGSIAADRWQDTRVSLPESQGAWRNLLTDETVAPGGARCDQLLARLPFAVLADMTEETE